MQNLHKIFTFLALFLCVGAAFAQKATLKGKMVDGKSKEALIGATVFLVVQGENTVGAVSDFDGNYEMAEIPAGTYKVVASYVGYASDTSEMTFTDGQALTKDFELGEEVTVLQGVLVVGRASRSNTAALTLIQQKSPALVTGISSQEIQRSPDRSTADVLKRVSGTSVQDNKFVVIRGLADRYNIATLNGLILPSTEPDRRAFSFDLFPSALLSNLLIYKTASPELPGEFGGGVITVNTREVADEPFFSVAVNAGYNTISTFDSYNFYKTGQTDWLGYDNTDRAIPNGVNQAGLENAATRIEQSKRFENDWAVNNYPSLAPTLGVQLSGGTNGKLFGRDFGMIAAVTYNNTQRVVDFNRADFNVDKSQLFGYTDAQNRKDITTGVMLNLTYRISDKFKIAFNNIYSAHGDDQFSFRNGLEIEQQRINQSYSMLYQSTSLLTNQLLGENAFGNKGVSLKWGVSFNNVSRNTPSFRRISYFKDEGQTEADPFVAFVPFGAPSPNFAGRFYSTQDEKTTNGFLTLAIPYGKKGGDEDLVKQSTFKVGAFAENKDRNFSARVFGYVVSNSSSFNFNILSQPIDQIFNPNNIGDNGFRVRESTNRNDSYDAGSDMAGGFVMADHYFSDKFRLTGGVRLENFNQLLSTFTFGGAPISLDRTTTDLLPSLNLSYSVTKKANIRFAASQTVSRPNFRELAPFSFYDFNLAAAIVGSPDLVRTKITNLDLKYELFPSPSENFSVTAFYKRFDEPIEQFYETLGGGTRNFNFKNADFADNYGIELEFRKKLTALGKTFSNTFFFTNLAYIQSVVDVSRDAVSAVNASERPLQGQSPYIINAGLAYANPSGDFSATLLYNRIGRRIWLVGSNQYLDTYENPRNVMDFQISKKIFKSKSEIKLNIQDIFNNRAVFYQDQDDNGKFNEAEDTQILNILYGTNITIGFSYKF